MTCWFENAESKEASPAKVDTYAANNFLNGLVRSAREVQAILNGARETRLYTPELKRCRLGLLDFGEVHLQKVLFFHPHHASVFRVSIGRVGVVAPTVAHILETRWSDPEY